MTLSYRFESISPDSVVARSTSSCALPNGRAITLDTINRPLPQAVLTIRFYARTIRGRVCLITAGLELFLVSSRMEVQCVSVDLDSTACFSFGLSTHDFADTKEILSYTRTIIPTGSIRLSSRAANIGTRIQP